MRFPLGPSQGMRFPLGPYEESENSWSESSNSWSVVGAWCGLVTLVRAEAGRCITVQRTWMPTAETSEEARRAPGAQSCRAYLGKEKRRKGLCLLRRFRVFGLTA